MMTYQQFVKKNLKYYIRAGLHPNDAMRMVARDWWGWKYGIGNPSTERYFSICDGLQFELLQTDADLIRLEYILDYKKYLPELEKYEATEMYNRLKKRRTAILREARSRDCDWYNPRKNPQSLYESFHGSPPARIRKIKYEPPKGILIKIGKLSQLNYIPEYPSMRKGVEYYHRSGDIGHKILKSNAILATDIKGKNLYILKDKNTKYPKFTERGIVG